MASPDTSHRSPRPSVGVHFKCCNVYSQVYLDHSGAVFAGHCPRCAAAIEIPVVKEGGSSSRFFSGS